MKQADSSTFDFRFFNYLLFRDDNYLQNWPGIKPKIKIFTG